jgi:hypothetical protein
MSWGETVARLGNEGPETSFQGSHNSTLQHDIVLRARGLPSAASDGAPLTWNSVPALGRHRFELFEQFTQATRKRRSHISAVFGLKAPAYFPQPQPSAVHRKPSRPSALCEFQFHARPPIQRREWVTGSGRGRSRARSPHPSLFAI